MLKGINGEIFMVKDIQEVHKRILIFDEMYKEIKPKSLYRESVLLEAFSSATIEGARTTLNDVRHCLGKQSTKSNKMVENVYNVLIKLYNSSAGLTYENLYGYWIQVVDGVCENTNIRGKLYRSGMVYIGDEDRVVHTPAKPQQIKGCMRELFNFLENSKMHPLVSTIIGHFYFIYVHPFCDGNCRMARILELQYLQKHGYPNIRYVPVSSVINNKLNRYYKSISFSEIVVEGKMDLSPFILYMLEVYIDAMNTLIQGQIGLSQREKLILSKVKVYNQISVAKAKGILNCSESTARITLNSLEIKGYFSTYKEGRKVIYNRIR